MEILDIYNDNHELIGTCEKKEAHRKGLWHEIFTCIVINPELNKVYLQVKNHKHNKIHDVDLIDITAGGHIQSGETIEDGIRELKEETGLDVKFSDLINLGIRQVATTVNPEYIVREFQNIFLYPTTVKLNELKCADDEVSYFISFDIDELIELLLNERKDIIGETTEGKINITLKNFIKSYLEKDKLYLRLLIASKRYVKGENIKYIFF